MARKHFDREEAEFREVILALNAHWENLLAGFDPDDDDEESDEVIIHFRAYLSELRNFIGHKCLVCDGHLELEFMPGVQIFLYLICNQCDIHHMVVQGKLGIYTH